MCGRFASTQTDADLVRAFRVEEVVGEQRAPSYNVAPTQPIHSPWSLGVAAKWRSGWCRRRCWRGSCGCGCRRFLRR